MKNKIKLLITFVLTLVCLLGVFTGSVFAEGVDIEALKEKCEQLPTVKTVSIEDKDLIVEVKSAYESLSIAEKGQLGSENLAKISEVYTAFEPLLLGDTVVRTVNLPEKITDKEKDEVVAIYNQYVLLGDDAKESFDAEKLEKLMAAVKKVAPELLGEEEATGEAEGEKTEEEAEETSGEPTLILGMYIWEFVILAVLAVVTLFNIALMVMVAVKVFKK